MIILTVHLDEGISCGGNALELWQLERFCIRGSCSNLPWFGAVCLRLEADFIQSWLLQLMYSKPWKKEERVSFLRQIAYTSWYL